MTRRELLSRTACGFGMAALTGIDAGVLGAAETNPLAPKVPPLPARAKCVIAMTCGNLLGLTSRFAAPFQSPRSTR